MGIISRIPSILIKRLEDNENVSKQPNAKPSKEFKKDVSDLCKTFIKTTDSLFMNDSYEEIRFLKELRTHNCHCTVGEIYKWLKTVKL